MLRKFLPEAIAVVIGLCVFTYVFCKPLGLAEGGMLHTALENSKIAYITEPSGNQAQFSYLLDGNPLDIRSLGAVYSLLILAGIILIIHFGKGGRTLPDILLAVLTPLIFLDFAYVSYVNTFFPQAAFFAAALIFIGIAAVFIKKNSPVAWVIPVILAIVACFSTFSVPAANPSADESPTGVFSELAFNARNGYNIRPSYLSNFRDTTEPTLAHGFDLYSSAKAAFTPNNLAFTLIILAAYAFVVIKSKASKIYLALPILAILSLAVPLFTVHRANIGMNLFAFNVFFDLLVLTSIVGGVRIIQSRNATLRQKFGVTQ
ncbi:MAG: hypothetical protein LBL34_00455 [Clostridiales bacterium]|jgi:hypothetical protein|nr:hypothetical protein [Clostridiales bacterium]